MLFPLNNEVSTFFANQRNSVVKNLMIVTQGIFAAKSTNLNKVKDHLGNILENQDATLPASNYKRLIRFFSLSDEEKQDLTKSLLAVAFFVLGKAKKLKYLALDGTSWQYGAKKIHLMTLSIVMKGVSIPICWEELDKKGTSNYEERVGLINRACKWYNLKGMILLADREYIGERWFKYLVSKGLHFVIRLKKKIYKGYIDEQRSTIDATSSHQKLRYIGLERAALKPRYKNVGVAKQIEILNETYTFVVFKNPKPNAKEALLYFISTLPKKQVIVNAYPIRWTIECCFKHLKSNGFNLEDLNLKDGEKIKLMMAIVSFLYALCIQQGLLTYTSHKKSDFKRYKDGKITLAVSVFRKGLAIITGKFYHLKSFLQYLANILIGKTKPKWINVQ